METRTLRLKPQASPLVDGPELLIMPIGDVQLGATACDKERFKRHIAWGVENGAWFVGMGDYVDYVSPSNRAILGSLRSTGKLYDTVWNKMDQGAEADLEELQEILAPTVGRWLGLLRGHHFWVFPDGTTSDTRLAEYLECDYLGTSTLLKVEFIGTPKAWVGSSFIIQARHGETSSATVGGIVNALLRQRHAWPMADIVMMGHTHRKLVVPEVDGHMEPQAPMGWRDRKVMLVSTGSFLRAYMPGEVGTYVEERGLAPVALGGVVLRVRPRKDKAVDIEASV